MFDEENQMGLFEIPGAPPELRVSTPTPPPAPAVKSAASSPAKPAPAPSSKKASDTTRKQVPARSAAPSSKGKAKGAPATPSAPPIKKVSGLVPEGDVRLTANIRQDLHLKLKIASAHRRTTIGEILEELIEAYL